MTGYQSYSKSTCLKVNTVSMKQTHDLKFYENSLCSCLDAVIAGTSA